MDYKIKIKMKNYRWIIYVLLLFLAVLMAYETSAYYTMSKNTITVGYIPSDHHAALFVADYTGMFKKAGLNVQMVPFQSGTEMVEAINRDLIDVGYCGIAPAIKGIDEGVPIKVVAPVNLEGSGIIVKNESINSAKDLQNKKIATPKGWSIQDILLMYYFNSSGYSTNSLCNTESEVPLMDEDLEMNSIDAFIAWEPYISQTVIENEGNLFLYTGDIWKDHPCCVVIARQDFIEEKPQLLQRFLNVHLEATEYIQLHPNETAAILSNKLGINITTELTSLQHVKFNATLTPQYQENTTKLVSFMRDLNLINNNLTSSDIFDSSFIHNN